MRVRTSEIPDRQSVSFPCEVNFASFEYGAFGRLLLEAGVMPAITCAGSVSGLQRAPEYRPLQCYLKLFSKVLPAACWLLLG
jgi:hypothetical protein